MILKPEISENGSPSIAETITVNDIFKRVISLLHTAEHTLYTTNDNGAYISGQQLDDENVSYARITNHDASNYITLRLKNANDDERNAICYAGNGK